MRVYFVRHAQSKLNALDVHQFASVGLSELGVAQAQRVAGRLANTEIDAVVSSTHERARQTAQVIGDALQRPVEFTPLFRELKRPSAIEGKHHDDPEAIRIKDLIRVNFHDPTWRYADEDTFLDLRERAQRCIAYLTQLGRERVLVVTHGGILTMIVAVMLHGDDLAPQDFLRLRSFVRTTNTGITVCDYTPETGWMLLTWNDHAHLESLAGLSACLPESPESQSGE